MRCQECGCTDAQACETDLGPCFWVADQLCSACAPELVELLELDAYIACLEAHWATWFGERA